jgi:hypothetical protein
LEQLVVQLRHYSYEEKTTISYDPKSDTFKKGIPQTAWGEGRCRTERSRKMTAEQAEEEEEEQQEEEE